MILVDKTLPLVIHIRFTYVFEPDPKIRIWKQDY